MWKSRGHESEVQHTKVKACGQFDVIPALFDHAFFCDPICHITCLWSKADDWAKVKQQ